MAVIQKFLWIVVLLHTDGSFSFEKRLVDGGCPPREIVMINMDMRQKKGEFVSWDGTCFPVVFKKEQTI